ncbi:MAG: hypothetical protein N4A63_09830 [Vallitalea sp.]|jgi:hypothetical protein|nr:hypothetical protein [Vallitalea sp.]MCT4597719.1 hypothetical protein [Vallitalea sp.]
MNDGLYSVIAWLSTFFLFFFIVGIIFYCLKAIGLMTMAKKRGIENSWLSWIPIGNYYIVGKLIDTIDFGDKKIENAPMVLLLAGVGVLLLSFIPIIGAIVVIVFIVLYSVSLYKLYFLYKPGSEVLYLVLSIIFPNVAIGIIIFLLRNNELSVQD